MNYKQLSTELEQKKRLINKDYWLKQFTCDYCPTTGHKLCTHKDKCLMDSEVLDIITSIQRVNQRIAWIKNGAVDKNKEILLERLRSERKELFKKYWNCNTKVGGLDE